MWQVDRASDPQKIMLEAERREDVVCISALTGDGLQEFCNAVQEKLKVLNRCLYFYVLFFIHKSVRFELGTIRILVQRLWHHTRCSVVYFCVLET